MSLETERLILRRWQDSDAEDLYKYASDPDVGPIAGWPVHKNVQESLGVIRYVFCGAEAYAVCLKQDNKAIGAIELKLNGNTDLTERDDECELGYWIGKPFWGQGLVPEAVREIIRYAFTDKHLETLWCGYFEGNDKSRRVQEKCGFSYHHTDKDIHILHTIDQHIEYCTGCFSCMRNGGTCIHNDDMKAILEEILDSDLLIWSFPLYCYGMPASLKVLLDRTLPLSSMAMQKVGDRYEHVEQADFSRLKYLMICGCGFPNSRHNFEPAEAQFKLCFPGDHTIITVPESPMFNAPEAAVVTVPRLEQIKQAGRQYAEKGEIEASLLAEITSPMIPEEQYAAIVNSGV